MIEVKCKGCGKKLYTYDNTSFRRYASPVKQCKKCGKSYADHRFHEIAVEGIPSDTFSVKSYLFLIVFGAFIAYRGLRLSGLHQLGTPDSTQWLLPVLLTAAGGICIVGGIYEIITICTGVKQAKFDKRRTESEERMKDADYVRILSDLGYEIPEKYNIASASAAETAGAGDMRRNEV